MNLTHEETRTIDYIKVERLDGDLDFYDWEACRAVVGPTGILVIENERENSTYQTIAAYAPGSWVTMTVFLHTDGPDA